MTGKQKAGNKSLQVQAETIVVGIDEKRVREIVDERLQIALKDFSEEASKTAILRNGKFNKKLINRMVAEDALSAFADPSFQLLLMEAQKRAAATEREPDYDLLSELMLHRFKKGSNRKIRAGISRAVEIVDQISDDALLALTIFHATSYFVPVSGNIKQGLDVLNDLFNELIYDKLPTDNEWLDHLDMLDAIRISSLGIKPLEDYWMEKLDGYSVKGIENNSEEYREAIIKLQSVGINEKSLVKHQLNANNVRLELVNKDSIDNLLLTVSTSKMQNAHTKVMITDKQAKVLKEVYDMSNKSRVDKQKFIDELEKRPSLKLLRGWWNNIQQSLQITSAGKVLAHSNAQRIDKNLPPLD